MERGHCGACRRKWRLTDTDLCPCGETQTMSHIVESCPLTKLNGGLSQLHSADEDTVSWLTSYGSWHAYDKKIKLPLTSPRAVRNGDLLPVCHSVSVCSFVCCRFFRVTTCLENLEMSGNLTAVREKILSGKSCLKLFIVNCIFASIQVFSRSLFFVKYVVSDHALLHSYAHHWQ